MADKTEAPKADVPKVITEGEFGAHTKRIADLEADLKQLKATLKAKLGFE